MNTERCVISQAAIEEKAPAFLLPPPPSALAERLMMSHADWISSDHDYNITAIPHWLHSPTLEGWPGWVNLDGWWKMCDLWDL